jgi:hypothetical protein
MIIAVKLLTQREIFISISARRVAKITSGIRCLKMVASAAA